MSLHPAIARQLEHFNFGHLSPELSAVSSWFFDLACKIVTLPEGPEVTVALRKILEAKDCAVRAMLPVGRPTSTDVSSAIRDAADRHAESVAQRELAARTDEEPK